MTSAMRVLHVGSGNLFGGVEAMLLTIAAHSAAAGMEARFAFAFEGAASKALRDAGRPVAILGDVRVSRPLTVMRARRAMRALLRAERPDVVVCHSPWPHALFAPIAAAERLPVAFWLHDPPQDGPLHWLERFARRCAPALVVCNSRFTAARAPRLFPGVRTEVVNCPVEPALPMAPGVRDEVRTRHGAVDGETVILQVGRWEPHKGHFSLLDALAPLRDRRDWVCWQVGRPQRPAEVEYHDAVRAHAKVLGVEDRVRFLGWQPDVRELFAAADVYCQPNVGMEPFGITFVEALYAGLPVVGTDLGGPSEIITPDVGALVAPGDVLALTHALRALLDDRAARERVAATGPLRAAQLSDPVARMIDLAALLGSVTGDASRTGQCTPAAVGA